MQSKQIPAMLALLSAFAPQVQCVRCFSCTVKPRSKSLPNETTRLCSNFDGGRDFEVDCPLSTFCQTRTFYLHTHSESVAVTTRGCAHQDYSFHFFEKGRGWKMVTKIEETIYKEGCFKAVGSSLRRHKTEYCYCSKDLCNQAVAIHSPCLLLLQIVFLSLVLLIGP